LSGNTVENVKDEDLVLFL